MTELKVENLKHVYPNGVTAVNGVNVSISQGEQISVVGQNGSGKTTLVKHWNGLLKPTGGKVFVGDLDTHEHHVFSDKYWDEGFTIINRKCYSDKIWNNSRSSRPCFNWRFRIFFF